MSRFKKFIDKNPPGGHNGFYINESFSIPSTSLKYLNESCIYFENYIYKNFNKLMLEITLYVDEGTYKLARQIEEIEDISLEKLERFLYNKQIRFIENNKQIEGITGTTWKNEKTGKFYPEIQYKKNFIDILINNGLISQLAFDITFIVAHEEIHIKQYTIANMSDEILKKTATSNLEGKKNSQKKYYSHTREIMAFAQNIFHDLITKYKVNRSEFISELKSNPLGLISVSKIGRNYLEVFKDEGLNSPVIKKLLKYLNDYINSIKE